MLLLVTHSCQKFGMEIKTVWGHSVDRAQAENCEKVIIANGPLYSGHLGTYEGVLIRG